MPFTTLDLPRFRQQPPAVATDVTQLLAAASFIRPGAGDRRDPRAWGAFDAVATAFCNGADLYVPLPRSSLEDVPIFGPLWKHHAALHEVPNRELADEEFDRVDAFAADALASYVEGVPDQAAAWVAFQFSQPLVEDTLRRSAAASILRAGESAARLFERRRLRRFESAVLRLQRESGFHEPERMEPLLGRGRVASLPMLCAAFLLSVAYRGASYADGLRTLAEQPVYRHHWIRLPVLRAAATADGEPEEVDAPLWFPWGPILRHAFDQRRPLVRPVMSRVADVLDGIRCEAAELRSLLAESSVVWESSVAGAPHVSEAEARVLRILHDVGVVPLYQTRSALLHAAKWLRDLLKETAPMVQVPVQLALAGLQPVCAREAESTLRLRYRRDTFWDVFENPGLAEALCRLRRAHALPKVASGVSRRSARDDESA